MKDQKNKKIKLFIQNKLLSSIPCNDFIACFFLLSFSLSIYFIFYCYFPLTVSSAIFYHSFHLSSLVYYFLSFFLTCFLHFPIFLSFFWLLFSFIFTSYLCSTIFYLSFLLISFTFLNWLWSPLIAQQKQKKKKKVFSVHHSFFVSTQKIVSHFPH